MKSQELNTLQLEALLGKYIAKNGQVNPQFSKQVNLLSETDKKKIWREVKVRNLDQQRNRVRQQYLREQRAIEALPVAAEPVITEPVLTAPTDVVLVAENLATANIPINEAPLPINEPQDDDDLDDEDDEDEEEEEEEEEEETTSRRGPGRGPRIMWTEDEWDKLAETVYGMRRKFVIPALAKLVNRAMKQMPAERRRNLQGTTLLKPLLERLQKMEAEEKSKAEDYDRYRSQIQQMGKIPTREELIDSITDEELDKLKFRVATRFSLDAMHPTWKEKFLENLTEEEILARFSQTVLDNHTPDQLMKMVDPEYVLDCLPFPKVFGFVAEHCMESIGQFSTLFTAQPVFKQMRPATYKQPEVATPAQRAPQAPATPAIPKVARVEKPKITIIGLKGGQEQTVSQQLGHCDLTFIKSEAKSKVVPDGQDVIVLWAKFTSHCLQSKAKAKAVNGTKLITHHGGTGEMIEKIQQVLSGETLQPTRPGSGVGVN